MDGSSTGASSPTAAPPVQVQNVISFPEHPTKEPQRAGLGRAEKLVQVGILENLTRAFGLELDREALTGPVPMSPEEVKLLVEQRVTKEVAAEVEALIDGRQAQATDDWIDEFERLVDEDAA